jgi:hypothetical protein
MLPRLEAAVATLTDALETDRKHVSLTDPDAQMMAEGRNKKVMECHSFEVATDNGLLVCAQTSQSGQDNSRLPGLVEGSQANEPAGVTHVTADSGYFGTDNVVALEAAGISTCIPDTETARLLRKGPRAEDASQSITMAFDATANCFWCPQGKRLKLRQRRKSQGQMITDYQAESDCTECPIKSTCMSNQNAKRRMLKVGDHREEIADILARFHEEDHRNRYHDRGKNVETVFAFIRTVLGFNRWSLRGDTKIDTEGALLSAAYQLRKIHVALRATA